MSNKGLATISQSFIIVVKPCCVRALWKIDVYLIITIKVFIYPQELTDVGIFDFIGWFDSKIYLTLCGGVHWIERLGHNRSVVSPSKAFNGYLSNTLCWNWFVPVVSRNGFERDLQSN